MLATELFSYRDLPQIWYQMHTKFRDEPRPKSGLLRVREFTMKDSYTLDIDRAGLDAGFEKHRGAYQRIFARMGLDAVGVEASSGAMGGSESVEFMVRSEAGEDWIVTCANCDYRANVERATSAVAEVDDGQRAELDRFPTPGLRTIKALAQAHPDTAAPDRQIKTLVYVLDGEQVLVLLRGDHNLQEQKLMDATATVEARAAVPEEIRDDFQVLADAYEKIAQALEGVDLSSETPPADAIAKLAQLSQEIDSAALTEASQNISDWTQENCSIGG